MSARWLPAVAFLLAASGPPARAASGCANIFRHGVLLSTRGGHDLSVGARGLPVLSTNGEFVVHRAWQEVYYRNDGGRPAALEVESDAVTTRDESDRFRFRRRVSITPAGVRIELEYALVELQAAELQVLYRLDGGWLDRSDYALIRGEKWERGRLDLPARGRIDPWSGATYQSFTADRGTLRLTAGHGLNLLCEPRSAAVYWSEQLEGGRLYRRVIDLEIRPDPALAGAGLVVGDLLFPGRVRDGEARLALRLARAAGGPEQAEVRLEPATRGVGGEGAARRVALGPQPVEIALTAPLLRSGVQAWAAVIRSPAGEEILRLTPLFVEAIAMLHVVPRLSYYTGEETAEIVVELADDVEPQGAWVEIEVAGATHRRAAGAGRMLVPVPVADLPEGESEVRGRLRRGGETLGVAYSRIRRHPPFPHEVKIDQLRRGLLVDGLPFFPFGFYCYWPINRVLDEEVVNGFTLLSSYQGGPHSDEKLDQIQAYLDRAAQIGMKVNYQIMWAYRAEWNEETRARLRAEVERFRDHPALLSWYTADEPDIDSVDRLGEVYHLIRELDPYHPVTIVFYQGGEHARHFFDVLDIVMADPYPIPNASVRMVSDMADAINAAFGGRKPLWIVPQAFGGGEWWRREPTAREQRAMTCLALIHGASGIKYFIRAPRVSFPKSPILWAECSRLALETAELAPALLSSEPRPEVRSLRETVHAGAWRDRGVVALLAVNTASEPQTFRLELPGIDYSGEAEVLFEQRTIAVRAGVLDDLIDGFGSRAYALPVGPLPEEDLAIDPANLTVNPSYEDNASAGTPAGYYADIGDGATAFVDARTARHGRHSLRLIAPAAEQVLRLSAFPFRLQEGRSYRVSLWARAQAAGVLLRLESARLGTQEFALTTEWKEYAFSATADRDEARGGIALSLASPGTAWLDLFQVVPQD